MADTTLEQARRCPKCLQPGKEARTQKAPNNAGEVHFFQCENTRCVWNGELWPVQVRPDGTIPQPDEDKGPSNFPAMSPDMLSRGQRIVEDAVGRDLREQEEL